MTESATRGCVAQFGDVGSYGDCLFALLSERGLRDAHPVRAVGFGDGRPRWLDAVTPRAVHDEVQDDRPPAGVLLGGGAIIAGFEEARADTEALGALGRLAHPLLWMGAGIRAARAGVPLCWLAPGVRGPLPPGLAAHLRWLATVSDLVAVRDEASRRHLIAAGVADDVLVVPDPTWEVDRIWDADQLRRVADEILAAVALEREDGYVLVDVPPQQPCPLDEVAVAIEAIERVAECRALLLVPEPGAAEQSWGHVLASRLRETTPVIVPDRLVATTAAISGARLYLGSSLSGLITALSLGVPAIAVVPKGQDGAAACSGQLEQVRAKQLLAATWATAARTAKRALALTEKQRLGIRERARAPLEHLWGRVESTLAAPVDAERKQHQLASLVRAGGAADDPAPALSAVIAMWMAPKPRPGPAPSSPLADPSRLRRQLERRLDAASRQILAVQREREDIAATVAQLRRSTIDFQRELHLSDAQRRALTAALDRLSGDRQAVLRENQRVRAQRDELVWRRSDTDLALAEMRELFLAERTTIDELAKAVRLALEDLRRAEAAPGSRLGRAIVKAAGAVRKGAGHGEAPPDPLYLGLARLDELDARMSRRARPPLPSRPSRVGAARRKVTIISWEMGDNPVGRAHALAQILSRSHEVEIIGPLFPRYGSKIWGPIRDSEIPMRTFAGRDLPGFVADAERFVHALRTDLVLASKPRFPSLLLAMLIKHARGVPVIVDVDDHELSFFGSTAGVSFEEFERGLAESGASVPFGRSWTQLCDQLIEGADAVTVSGEALHNLYGGTVVPHARDERLMNPARYDREALRAKLGYGPEDRVVLFSGTPRAHKGLGELAQALEQIDDPRYKLCVVGTVRDPAIRQELSRHGAERVRLLDDRPWSELGATTVIGDLVCLLQRADDPISHFQTPAKLTDALAMGVPVLARETPPLAPFARAGLIELVGEAPLAQRLAQQLGDPLESRRHARAGREYFLEHLSYGAVADTLDQIIAGVGGAAAEPPTSWRRALALARAIEPSDSGERLRPSPTPKLFPAGRRVWDVAFFWKQNDSWIYGRRSDMLMKYLARSDRTRRLVHFDAPASWEEVESYRRRSRLGSADQAAELYRRMRRRALFAERHGKLRSYTFLARSEHDPAAWERAFLPAADEYLGFIEHMMKRAGMGKRPVLFWVWPVNFQFPEIHAAFSPALTVADVVDDHRAWIKPGTSYYERLTENYEAVLGVSDVVLANCDPVRERMSWFGADPLVVPNAIEIIGERLRPSRRPPELRRLSGPIVGYVGNLGSRIDIPLLDRLADEHHDWQLVIIGSAHLSNDILVLDRHPNVHFLGVRPYPGVARYIRSFDVAIIPHRDDQLTRSMNPLKAYVYAGCGVPVVTTEIANLPDLGPAIRVAPSHDEFLSAVAEILEQTNAGALRATPRELLERQTWKHRIAQIERILDTAGEISSVKAAGTPVPAQP